MQISLLNAIQLKKFLTDKISGKAKQENCLNKTDEWEHMVQLCNLLPYSFKYLLTTE